MTGTNLLLAIIILLLIGRIIQTELHRRELVEFLTDLGTMIGDFCDGEEPPRASA